jgi:DNA invertase Pin-like site-specific DNA recombinase
MRAALYVRVSTFDQEPENQLRELRQYVGARGWTATEFVDRGVSGSKDKRPALDALLKDAKRRRFDVLVCWRLDRLGRNLSHLILLLDELQALGVAFVSLAEGIDATTPAGRLQLHVLGAIAKFERERIRERVVAGLQRARAQGRKLGRPKAAVPVDRMLTVSDLPLAAAASALRVSRSTVKRWRRQTRLQS